MEALQGPPTIFVTGSVISRDAYVEVPAAVPAAIAIGYTSMPFVPSLREVERESELG